MSPIQRKRVCDTPNCRRPLGTNNRTGYCARCTARHTCRVCLTFYAAPLIGRERCPECEAALCGLCGERVPGPRPDPATLAERIARYAERAGQNLPLFAEG